jgi:hypothetical protein
MINNITTQKIFTFPDRKLYGEFCSIGLLELKLKIIKGDIKEQLCFIDENDRAYCFDKFGIPDSFPDCFILSIENKLLHEILKAQTELRLSEQK